MTVKVLYFAWVREATQRDEEALSFEATTLTAGDVLSAVLEHHPQLKDRADTLHLAINQDHAAPSDLVKDGDEIALFPPVTGG